MRQVKKRVNTSQKRRVAKLCVSCKKSSGCPGIRHCSRRNSGEKLPGFDPVN